MAVSKVKMPSRAITKSYNLPSLAAQSSELVTINDVSELPSGVLIVDEVYGCPLVASNFWAGGGALHIYVYNVRNESRNASSVKITLLYL